MYFMVMHFSPSLINFFIHLLSFLHFSSHLFFLSSKNIYLSLQRTRTLTICYDPTVRARITVLHSASLKGKWFHTLLFTSSRIILLYPPTHIIIFAATHRLIVTIKCILSINQYVFLVTATHDSLTSFSIPLDSIL